MAKRDFCFRKREFYTDCGSGCLHRAWFHIDEWWRFRDNTFNPRYYSAPAVFVVAPVVTVIGFVMMIFGILKNSKDKEVTE